MRRDLIIDTIAERESLDGRARPTWTRVSKRWRRRGTPIRGKCTRSSRRPDALQEIERELTEERVFAWLLERNTVSA